MLETMDSALLRRNAELESSLRDLLNDCINFGGENLSDCMLKQASDLLKKD